MHSSEVYGLNVFHEIEDILRYDRRSTLGLYTVAPEAMCVLSLHKPGGSLPPRCLQI